MSQQVITICKTTVVSSIIHLIYLPPKKLKFVFRLLSPLLAEAECELSQCSL